ncbi:MAG: tyrosine-type recombinase/integrase [Dehalococcoidia bacterium]|nr:tyrosine-type recombinase/integrase [Dehalococcoidia bacterium]
METYLEPKAIALMEEQARYARDRLLIRLLFHLGCRVSEALALTVGDIDLRKGLVTIVHLKTRVKLSCPHCQSRLSRSHQFCPACGSKVKKASKSETENCRLRTLPIDPDTLQMLKDYISRGGPVLRHGKMYIFGINRHRAWGIVRDCAERANLPRLLNPQTGKSRGISPHRLRDAFAVHAVKLDDSGDGLRLLQEHLGHANFNTTAKYRKISGVEHREWYEKLWKKDIH